ncbi:interleukin-10 receptor subunit beta isoform X2 [Esox lucius]|nr:interleukin-10 receptor subunit beta isoform X2 [Esox lucius]
MVSHNMDAILKWDNPLPLFRDITYTAEYKHSLIKVFQSVCMGTKECRCDFGRLRSVHGTYKFRVRTEHQRENSSWVEIPTNKSFSLTKETIIGPPKVTLVTKGGATGFIEVNIQDPVLKIDSLKGAYGTVAYNIRYWKETDKKNMSEIKEAAEQQVKLTPLEPNTRYCVQVQMYVPLCYTEKEYSNITCLMSTEPRMSEGLLVILLMVAFLLLFLICCVIYKGRKFLHPKVKLPEHFKKHLNNSYPCSYLASPITLPLQEKYDQINALDEENPYNEITCLSEDNLCTMDRGQCTEYYNAVHKKAKCDLPYRNI